MNSTLEKPPRRKYPRISAGDSQARRVAAVILDVLSGARSVKQAAEALEVSDARYYALEARAIDGLVTGCAPRTKGPRRSPEREIAKLRTEIERLKRECERRQALLRTAQRAMGLTAPAPVKPGRRGRRRPVKRALVASEVLRSEPPAAAPVVEHQS